MFHDSRRTLYAVLTGIFVACALGGSLLAQNPNPVVRTTVATDQMTSAVVWTDHMTSSAMPQADDNLTTAEPGPGTDPADACVP